MKCEYKICLVIPDDCIGSKKAKESIANFKYDFLVRHLDYHRPTHLSDSVNNITIVRFDSFLIIGT